MQLIVFCKVLPLLLLLAAIGLIYQCQSKLQSLDEIPPQSFAVVRHAPTWAVSALVFTVARIALALAAFFTPLFTVNRLAVLPADLEQTVSQLNLTILLPNTWSIASGVGQMAQAGSPYQHLFAFDMCVFLVVTPLASGLLALWCILKPFGDLPIFEMRLMHALSRFGNLEVFLMAFVLYLSEQVTRAQTTAYSPLAQPSSTCSMAVA